jgi:putative thioredoxin
VIEASMEVPVVLDFWAPWCGPCRMLNPLLQKLEREYGGRFKLVNANSDINPELVTSFSLQSIPYCVAFVDGNAVAQFTGAQPETYVRVFLDRLVPNPGALEHRSAREALARGDYPEAEECLRNAIALNPANDGARLDIVALLLEGDEVDRARSHFDVLSSRAAQQSTYATVKASMTAAYAALSLPPAEELHRRIRFDIGDLQARLDLAERHIAKRQFRPALEQLLEIVKGDRKFKDDIGRLKILDVFAMAADQADLVTEYRRKLSTVLY